MMIVLDTGMSVDTAESWSVRPGEAPAGEPIGKAWRGDILFKFYRTADGYTQYRTVPEYDPLLNKKLRRKKHEGRYVY